MPAELDDKSIALFALMVNLLRSGCEKYPERADIIRRLNDLYDSSCSIGGFASGENKIFEISSEMLADRYCEGESVFEGICELMYQMMFCPVLDGDRLFRAETVEREKNVILDKIKSQKNNTREYAMKRCRELMCKGEAYGTSVKSDVLSSLTREDVTDYYNDFISKVNLRFSYVGSKSASEVAEIIRKYFGNAAKNEKARIIPLSFNPSTSLQKLDEELNVKQGVLVIGMKTGVLLEDEFSHVMCVFNNVYGGTFTSRLFKTVREKMSLCYYCSSDYVNTKGLMFVSCGIDVNKREEAENAILKELEILKKELISDEELEVAKALTLKEFYDMLDFPGAIATFYFSRSMYGFDVSIEDMIEKVKGVTKEEIRTLAEKVIPDTVFFLKGTATDDEEDDYE
jgi:predicted Zn-dependent peptidase